MGKAIGYLRVSTVEQASGGVSLKAQREQIKAWAKAHGHALVAVYEDAGVSGMKDVKSRPGAQAAIERACEERAALVVYSLSRLARSTLNLLDLAQRIEKAGADLVSLKDSIDTTTATGRMLFRITASFAEFERDLGVERTRMALESKRSRSERISGAIPFGYDFAPNNRTLVRNDKEQQAIDLMRKLRGKGKSLRAICAELERRRVRSKSGVIKWSAAVVRGILRRDAA